MVQSCFCGPGYSMIALAYFCWLVSGPVLLLWSWLQHERTSLLDCVAGWLVSGPVLLLWSWLQHDSSSLLDGVAGWLVSDPVLLLMVLAAIR